MPKNFQKSLQNYLSKIKTNRPRQLRISSKKWIGLKGCKHPRTPSLSFDKKNNDNKDDEATLEDVDRFLFENFKSLYLEDDKEADCNNNTKSVVSSDEEEDDEEEEETREEKYSKQGPTLFDSSNETPLDLCGSNRFVLTRGFSGSTTTTTNTFEETGSCSNSSTPKTFNVNSFSKEDQMNIPDNCVVVLASSPSPYDDFRRSMQETVEARLRNNESVDWDFMEELLFCYMNLNEKKSYKFILSAFCDLISIMRKSSETKPEKPRSVRTVRIGTEVRKKKIKELTLEFEGSR
ncbi:putative transcription factor OFP family [Medicago truncatula]|uniref:Transcription repressor n=1 Tax=Medicago truncatula TaxID=3880 RepID=A0A072UI43_MEDTR|nr:transcription repressor OFP14 [Medicago truncatula]KEH28783.1 ovate transcriptional repressor [Medicago truncatula]RHN58621.1 putative transcription factor OFP family [Medicago truncatula]